MGATFAICDLYPQIKVSIRHKYIPCLNQLAANMFTKIVLMRGSIKF